MGGEFLGAGDKYLPLKFNIAGSPHYGWVRVNVDNTCSQFTIKDYAYNATANQLIFAGQMVGINERVLNRLNIEFSEGQLKILNTQDLLKENFRITLYDMGGKRIIRSRDFTIDTKNFTKGVYIAELYYNEATLIRKVLVE